MSVETRAPHQQRSAAEPTLLLVARGAPSERDPAHQAGVAATPAGPPRATNADVTVGEHTADLRTIDADGMRMATEPRRAMAHTAAEPRAASRDAAQIDGGPNEAAKQAETRQTARNQTKHQSRPSLNHMTPAPVRRIAELPPSRSASLAPHPACVRALSTEGKVSGE